ncbi:hypothetical protein [Desnuesiella massiliensis]|uniref:hypothetical protein n=1 Tax=Desnuesiella massiliensis TaxID=1650662 RepID=UPI0006E2B0B7|nr:hypothetical protein [Desnuesiella massiliensis]
MKNNARVTDGIKVGSEIIFKGHIYEKVKDGFCANEGWSHVIIYKGNKYEFSDLLKLYLEKTDDEWTEILPDIKMKHRKLGKRWWQFWKEVGFEWEFRINLDTKLWIEVYYETLPVGFEEPKLLWFSGKAKVNERKRKKLEENWNNDTHFVLDTVLKEVPVKDIVNYPDALGKGVSGCIQLYNYMKKGLYNPSDEWNGEMTINDVLETSAKYEEQVKECINSERCGWLYKQHCNGSLKELDDYVRLNEVDGKFYLGSNGNHRICLLKRIKSEKIYAKVSIWEKRKNVV